MGRKQEQEWCGVAGARKTGEASMHCAMYVMQVCSSGRTRRKKERATRGIRCAVSVCVRLLTYSRAKVQTKRRLEQKAGPPQARTHQHLIPKTSAPPRCRYRRVLPTLTTAHAVALQLRAFALSVRTVFQPLPPCAPPSHPPAAQANEPRANDEKTAPALLVYLQLEADSRAREKRWVEACMDEKQGEKLAKDEWERRYYPPSLPGPASPAS